MRTVHRWGQSAYETDADLALEQRAAEALGLHWTRSPESDRPPPLDGVDALVVTSRVRVDRAALNHWIRPTPSVREFSGKLVITTTSGWEHIDVLAANDGGVTVARCPLARRDAVVEQALGAMIQLLRRQPAFDRYARGGTWARAELPALDPLILRDATVLIVGLGVIGRRLAEVLAPLGPTVLGVDPAGVPAGVVPVELEAGLARADVVTLHCAANPSTVGLLSAARIARIKPGAVLVNTARGKLVDPDAAVDAVRAGHLRGFAADVFPQEPWSGLAAAAEVDGVLLTPHSAGYARGLGTRVAREVTDALTAWVAGAPVPHRVEGIG